jgi:hypothetical protein
LNTHPKYGTDLSEYVNMMSYACALQYMWRRIDTRDFWVIFSRLEWMSA